MSAIQEPTPEMGPYNTAIRRESFYLNAKCPLADAALTAVDPHTLRVPTAHAAHLLATLDQITATKAYAEWAPGDGAERDEIVVARQGEHLCIRFPGKLHAKDWDDEEWQDRAIGTEVAYWEVQAFREQLTADPATLPEWTLPTPGGQAVPFPGTWQAIACTDRPALLLTATFRDGEVPVTRYTRHILKIPVSHVPEILTTLERGSLICADWNGEPRYDGIEVTRQREGNGDILMVDFPDPITYEVWDEEGEAREDTFLVQVDRWDLNAFRSVLAKELSR